MFADMFMEGPVNPGSASFVSSVLREIKTSLRGEPHTFSEVRRMMEDARVNGAGLLDVLQEHHRFLNESIVVLLDADSTVDDKQRHLSRFLRLLNMHGRAEEETLYRSLQQHASHEVVREGLVGKDQHEIAFQLAAGLREMDFRNNWTDDADAKTKVLASLVHHHLKEEEKVMFPLAKKSLLPGELFALTSDYLDLCEYYLDGDRAVSTSTFVMWPLNS